MATKYLDYNGLLYFWQKIKNLFAPLASPSFTGTPTAPTATTGTSSSQVATTEFVANSIGAMTSGVSDVKVDSTSVVTSGIANINTMTGATTSANGTKGLVPAPSAYSGTGGYTPSSKVLTAAGAWELLSFGTSVDQLSALYYTMKIGNATATTFNIPYVTTSKAGVMSSTDKTKLDSITLTNGIIDSSCLPSFVDDVIEAYPRSGQTELSQNWLSLTSSGSALTPETGKIYVLMADSTSYATNTQFRWGGTAYVKLADGGVSSITNGEIDTIVAS